MSPLRRLLRRPARERRDDVQQLVSGWDWYARTWRPDRTPVLPGFSVRYLGDEWTGERAPDGNSTTYGLAPAIMARFSDFLARQLLDPYLPATCDEGLEIGPAGGGRLTALLLDRTRLLHVAEPSPAMLKHLRRRFAGVSRLVCHRTDGLNLPALRPASLDYVAAFDVFVHFEPRLVYSYLVQIYTLLKPGGTGIIHYANVTTELGWHQFKADLGPRLAGRSTWASFGVMCPELMVTFLSALGFTIVAADTRLIPRDAVAVFRR